MIVREARRDRDRVLVGALATVFLVVIGLGAWQLARSQHSQRVAYRERFEQRPPIAASLFDGLLSSMLSGSAGQLPQLNFGRPVVEGKVLDDYAQQQGSVFALVVDAGDGRVVGRSSGVPRAMRSNGLQPFERLALRHGYGLSDLIGGSTPAIASAVPYDSPSGKRLIVNGAPLSSYITFLERSLTPVAPVSGGGAFVIDGSGHPFISLTKDRGLGRRIAARGSDSYELGSPQGRLAVATAPAPGTHWRVALAVSKKLLYRPASGFSGRWLPWLILALFAVALLVAVWLVQRVVRARRLLGSANERLGHANQRLEGANAELTRSNSELEEFAYVASHDLSSPLRSIAGFTSLLSKRYRGRLDGEADRYIGFVEEGVERMQHIIDDLLAYSRVGHQGDQAGPVALEEVFGQLQRTMASDIEEKCAVITHDALPTVWGDRTQLAQLLQNLLGNAMTYVSPGVTPRVHVAATPYDGSVRIAVSDNGIGIDPEQSERIFKMFQRLHTRDDYPGTGIGLSIARKVVERHGSVLTVEPAPGGGSVFAFSLPVHETAVREAVPAR